MNAQRQRKEKKRQICCDIVLTLNMNLAAVVGVTQRLHYHPDCLFVNPQSDEGRYNYKLKVCSLLTAVVQIPFTDHVMRGDQ